MDPDVCRCCTTRIFHECRLQPGGEDYQESGATRAVTPGQEQPAAGGANTLLTAAASNTQA
jgi:hypothetical protein